MESSYWQRYAHSRATRRRFLASAATSAAGAAGLALAGCGDGGAKPTPASTSTGTTPTAEPVLRGGTLRLPLNGIASADWKPPTSPVARSLLPYGPNVGYPIPTASAYHYSRLLRPVARADVAVEDRTVVEGDLASGFEQIDPVTYRFALKPNAKWQNKAPLNGRAVTATDCVKAYEALVRLSTPRTSTNWTSVIDRVEAPDEGTVKFTLKAPYAPFFHTLLASDQGLWIIPPETMESGQAATDPVGSGPYLYREDTPSVSVTWDRNPDYYDAPLPNFERVEASLKGANTAGIVAGLQSGEFDLSGLSGVVFKESRAKFDPRGQFIFPQGGVAGGLFFNFDNKPFQDKRVRQALSLLLDRPAYLNAQDGTLNGKWMSHLPPNLAPFYLDPQTPAFGPNARFFRRGIAEAKALLSAAGAEGLKFRLVANVDVYGPVFKQSWEMIAASLREGGLQPELVFEPFPIYNETTYLGVMPEGTAAVGPFVGIVADPDVIFQRVYWSKSVVHNWGGTPIPEQAAIDADIAKQRTILDVRERTAFIHEMQRKMAESMLTVPYHANADCVYAQPWMKNFFWKAGLSYLPDSLMKAHFDADRLKKG